MESPGQMLQIATEVQRASVRVLGWARAAAQSERRCGRDVSSQASRGRVRRRRFVAGGHRTAGAASGCASGGKKALSVVGGSRR
jgi:hypothetical protein